MSSLVLFSNAINKIRDIMRGPGMSITGMDSMRHICIYLLARYITTDKNERLGIPKELTWENIIDEIKNKNSGAEKALELFYHPDMEHSLITHFDRLFGTNNFTFEIKSPSKHKEIIEIIDKINFDELECKIDMLGWVYEIHLKTGSAAARDLGQFFTDRDICNYMVYICQPKIKENGLIESVCDPTMGTAGFLTSYIRYFNQVKDIDWDKNQTQINGCDSDSKVSGVARLNFFIETKGCVAKNLLTHDSLYNDLPKKKYDIILANMPFGIKGIKYEECCERIRSLKIKGTKSEPLFLQLMGLSLEEGGRCAVVVPDGMLNNVSKIHNDTRKYIIDNFDLKYVIKMNGSFFMNTSIQTSILYFENNGYSTGAITFIEVVKNEKGEIEQKPIHAITRDQLDKNFSFDVKKYKKEEVVKIDNSYTMVKLEDIMNGKKYPSHDTSYGKEIGPYRFYTGGENNKLYIDNPDIDDMVIILNRTNGSGKCNIFLDSNCSVAKQTIVFACKSLTTTKFVYYYIYLNKDKMEKGYIGSNHKNLSNDFVNNFEIPLPSIEVQKMIVDKLDVISKGKQKAQEIISNLKEQMEAVIDSSSSKSKEVKMIKDVVSIQIGGTPLRSVSSYYENGTNLWVSVSELNNNVIYDTKEKITDEGVKNSNVKLVKKDSVLMSFKLSIGKCGIAGTDLYTNEAIASFDSLNSDILLNKFFYYYICFNDFSENAKGSIGTGSLNKESLSNIEIFLPPIDKQKMVVDKLDKLQARIDAMEELIRDSEETGKMILDNYLGL